MDAFDADVLIFAGTGDHLLGRRVRALFAVAAVDGSDAPAGCGSVILLPELLSKPLRDGAHDVVAELSTLLGQLSLLPTDVPTARLAATVGATYRLRAADAVHLATAIAVGADRFITNNRRDFPTSIAEIEITYPDDLPDPSATA